METIEVIHPTLGRATVGLDQWNEKNNVTGWDEATARDNGWIPADEAIAAAKKSKTKSDA